MTDPAVFPRRCAAPATAPPFCPATFDGNLVLGDAVRKSGRIALGAVAAATTAALGMIGGPADPASGAPAAQKRPNIVVLMSDDQTQEEMRFMGRVRGLIGGRGATFPTSVTNWPLCCPSRATFQTGQYAHNHGVLGNQPPIGGFEQLDTSRTLPVWLQRSGYYTAHIGKFLNGYEKSSVGVPPGWSEWHGSKTTYTYYGYQLLENGQINTYGSPDENVDAPAQPETYSTDVYTDKAVDLIDRRAPETKPFFLSVAYLAPHSGAPNRPAGEPRSRCEGTAKPAIRHRRAFAGLPLPRPPNFNEADVSDKPDSVSNRPPLTDAGVKRVTRNYRCRAESLLAIDEGAKRIVDELRATGELDDTLLIYTSDNGFFHGEHRIESGKNRVYEEAIRVPLLMRGPGVERGVEVDDLAINADLAPTILDAANAKADFPLDGRSLLPLTEHPNRKHGRELLIEQESTDSESGEPAGVEYRAVRTSRYVYVDNTVGEDELYDLSVDPFELQNQYGSTNYATAQAALAQRLASLRRCKGASCRKQPSLELHLPRPVREGGRTCTPARDFVARVRNRSRSTLIRASFRVAGRSAGTVRSAPFERRIRPRLLRRKARPEISVDTELVDGRILTLHDRLRICR